MLGPLLVGAAVADTIGGIVTVAPSGATAVIGSGLAAAVAWNLVTWRLGLPSSSGHALVGGLVGAALVEGGVARRQLGRPGRRHPVGVFGVLDRARDLAGARGARRLRSLIRAAAPAARRARRGAGAGRCAAASG